MNQSTESDSQTPSSISAEDVLPPVQPPATALIMQLFLIPLVIVSTIVAVWFMFSYIARSGTNPEELVSNIEKVNHSSWQQALTLAQLVRDPRQTELRNNKDIVARLSKILRSEIEKGRTNKSENIDLRVYLCRLLGEFEVASSLDALAEASLKETSPKEVPVRRAAIQAIGILAGKVDQTELESRENVRKAIMKSTEEYAESGKEKVTREMLRSTATYVLGVLPGDEVKSRLNELLSDPSLDVGYNAAIGLARHGDVRALPMLTQMLDPPEDALDDPTPDQKSGQDNQREWKRTYIISNSLRSIGRMKSLYPATDLGELPDRIRDLSVNESRPSGLRLQAQEVLRSLEVAVGNATP